MNNRDQLISRQRRHLVKNYYFSFSLIHAVKNPLLKL